MLEKGYFDTPPGQSRNITKKVYGPLAPLADFDHIASNIEMSLLSNSQVIFKDNPGPMDLRAIVTKLSQLLFDIPNLLTRQTILSQFKTTTEPITLYFEPDLLMVNVCDPKQNDLFNFLSSVSREISYLFVDGDAVGGYMSYVRLPQHPSIHDLNTCRSLIPGCAEIILKPGELSIVKTYLKSETLDKHNLAKFDPAINSCIYEYQSSSK